jgi:hypothetical protein
MKEEKFAKLLNELPDATAEPVSPGLAEDIKHHIPQHLSPHGGRMDTVNIIIDLRINKLAAAAVIIIMVAVCANFFGARDSTSDGLYQDSRMLVKYFFGAGARKSDMSAVRSRYEYLVQKGKDVAYYGDSITPQDNNAVLMHWKLSDSKYRVTFADLHEETLTADELIKLQARMLQKKTK